MASLSLLCMDAIHANGLGDYWKWFEDNPDLLHGNLVALKFKFRILRQHSMI